MCQSPKPPSATNHSSITGPKISQMNLVPRYWKAKMPTRIVMAIGKT